MLTYPDYFNLLLTKIEPNSARLAEAQAIVPDVRKHLKKHAGITTCSPHTRLAGSYPRHTAIDDLKDVDTLVFVHADYLEDKPSVVLKALERALKDLPDDIGGGSKVELRKQRRSIHVCFADKDFHLDVVPAVITQTIDDSLKVPDREWEKWVDTHPLGYQMWLSELNDWHGGKVVPLIKLTKHWRDCQFVYKRPKSYWLECLVVRSIDRGWVKVDSKSYAEIFTDLLTSIYIRFEAHLEDPDAKPPRIPDPMLGNNVAWNWERGHFETFMARVKESRNWAQRALNMDEDHESDGVDLWQDVFENTFPSSAEIQAVKFAEAARIGSLYVNSQGRVSITPPTEGRVWQSPAHRFYGDDM